MYAVTVIPVTTARSVQFNHEVPSAAIFFGLFIFNLSGVFNVLLFLIIPFELLLFNDHEGILKTEVVNIGTNSAISNNTATDDHNPQPNGARLVDDGMSSTS